MLKYALQFTGEETQCLVGKVLDMSQTCRKVGQMLEIFDSDVEVFDTEQFFMSES